MSFNVLQNSQFSTDFNDIGLDRFLKPYATRHNRCQISANPIVDAVKPQS